VSIDSLSIRNGVKVSRHAPCLGHRAMVASVRGEYLWQDYETVLHRAHNLAAGFVSLGLKAVRNTEMNGKFERRNI
jgi:hypothetical protein